MLYINDDLASLDLAAALTEISEQRREKVLRIRHEQGRRESVAAYLLLKKGLGEEYGMTGNPTFAYREGGKPYITGHEDIRFNLSHCRTAAACALSSEEVGVDIERIRPYDDDLARRVLDDEEYDNVKASARPDVEFIKLWTRKEAVLKLTGEGIRSDLRSVLRRGDIKLSTTVNTMKNYVCTVAVFDVIGIP